MGERIAIRTGHPHVRVVTRDGRRAVETSVSWWSLGCDSRPRVALVGVAHFGTPDYYSSLGRTLRRCTRILHEDMGGEEMTVAARPLLAHHGLVPQQIALPSGRRPRWVMADMALADQLAYLSKRLPMVARFVRKAGLAGLANAVERAWALGVGHMLMLGGLEAVIDELESCSATPVTVLSLLSWQRESALVHLLQSATRVGKPGPVAVLFGADHLPAAERALRARHYRRGSVRWVEAFREASRGSARRLLRPQVVPLCPAAAERVAERRA